MKRILLVALLVLVPLAPASAAPKPFAGAGAGSSGPFDSALAATRRGDFASAVELYTTAIDDRKAGQDDLALAYGNRGAAHAELAQFQQAIADYGRALALAPLNPHIRYNRAVAHSRVGRFAKAITDYRRVVQGFPGDPVAHAGLGFALFHQGRFSAAAKSFQNHLKLRPHDDEAALWLYLARARAGRDGKGGLGRHLAATVTAPDWRQTLAALHLGRATPSGVLAAAVKAEPRERQGRLAEAHFHIAERYLLRGDRAAA
ncbi:MAG: tetratricopeptide repeat protein, partial [Alphaproteobacteria bacterium]